MPRVAFPTPLAPSSRPGLLPELSAAAPSLPPRRPAPPARLSLLPSALLAPTRARAPSAASAALAAPAAAPDGRARDLGYIRGGTKVLKSLFRIVFRATVPMH